MKNEQWTFTEINRRDLFYWSDFFQLPPLETHFFLTRGLRTPSEINKFRFGAKEDLSDPFEWDGIPKAAERIWEALESGEKICIYGDYDVDGIVGTSILIETIHRLGFSAEYYIPDRQEEGYGLNEEALSKLENLGINLLITVDCGTTSVELINKYQTSGMDIIVTDHHLPAEKLPNSFALINPQCMKGKVDPLAGAGVAFKLAQGLLKFVQKSENEIQDLLGWAALATVADMVPLQGENRILVKLGLEELKKSSSVGMQALISIADIQQSAINERDLGFALGPRLNASGRLETAKLGVELFLCKEQRQASEIAIALNEINSERKQIEKLILAQAKEMITSFTELPWGIVLYQEDWHPGVIGIVASRLAKEYWRPVILLGGAGEDVKGSGRSISGLNLYEALCLSKEFIDKFGGHKQAAGLSLKKENISDFRDKFSESIKQLIGEEDLIPKREFDGMLALVEIDDKLLERISSFAPFGIDNPAPKFLFPYMRIDSARALGAERQHLKIHIRDGSCVMETLLWNCGEAIKEVQNRELVHGIGTIRKNSWNGREALELNWEYFSLEPSLKLNSKQIPLEKVSKLEKQVFSTNRADFAECYRLLQTFGKTASMLSVERAGLQWQEARADFSWAEFDYFLQVFEELGLIRKVSEELIAFENNAEKQTSLEESPTYRKQKEDVNNFL
jgi:single-stranded-DNA-specific exonuclease RecJ